jgi:hypothetical protein
MNTLLRSLTLVLLGLVALGAHAERTPPREINPDRIVGIERPIETGSAAVLMPSSENGTLTVNQCANCRSERLTVNAKTRYFAGSQQVTLGELKALLDAGHPVSMTVFADLRQAVALRVIADVPTPSRPKNR